MANTLLMYFEERVLFSTYLLSLKMDSILSQSECIQQASHSDRKRVYTGYELLGTLPFATPSIAGAGKLLLEGLTVLVASTGLVSGHQKQLGPKVLFLVVECQSNGSSHTAV
nr:hypothetical protein Iba_chr11eCG3690 [Ipomoea batatas]